MNADRSHEEGTGRIASEIGFRNSNRYTKSIITFPSAMIALYSCWSWTGYDLRGRIEINFYRASACYACTVRYYYGKSVRSSDCLSVRHTLAVYAHAHMHISSNCFHLLVGALTPVFWAHRPPLKIPRGTSSAEVLNTRGLNNLLFSVEIPVYIGNGRDRPTVLWITNRKSQVADRSVSVPMILKGVNFFLAELRNYACMVWPRMT